MKVGSWPGPGGELKRGVDRSLRGVTLAASFALVGVDSACRWVPVGSWLEPGGELPRDVDCPVRRTALAGSLTFVGVDSACGWVSGSMAVGVDGAFAGRGLFACSMIEGVDGVLVARSVCEREIEGALVGRVRVNFVRLVGLITVSGITEGLSAVQSGTSTPMLFSANFLFNATDESPTVFIARYGVRGIFLKLFLGIVIISETGDGVFEGGFATFVVLDVKDAELLTINAALDIERVSRCSDDSGIVVFVGTLEGILDVDGVDSTYSIDSGIVVFLVAVKGAFDEVDSVCSKESGIVVFLGT